MRVIISVLAVMYSSFSFASTSCETQAALDALEEVRDLVKHEISVSNKKFQNMNDLDFSFGKMREQIPSKPETGVKKVVWVPIKIKKAGKTVWDVEQGFMYGDQCMRNRIAEQDAGIKVASELKKRKNKK